MGAMKVTQWLRSEVSETQWKPIPLRQVNSSFGISIILLLSSRRGSRVEGFSSWAVFIASVSTIRVDASRWWDPTKRL